jgi:hypothetical protein
MDQAQLINLVGSMYDKLVADVATRIEPLIDARIQAALDPKGLETGTIRQIVQAEIQEKLDDLTMHDKALIRNIVQDELENSDMDDKISDWMANNYDISEDVRDAVRDLTFTVTVD